MADQSETRTTTDHDEIRGWVEENGGTPASVRGTEAEPGEAGVLRIDFPGRAGEDDLEHVSWETWFEKFEDEGLALVYQARRADGGGSTFARVVRR